MTKEVYLKYVEIAIRAEKEGLYQGERLNLLMDIESADKTFNLRLDEWLNADSFNFAHDLCGIVNNIVRDSFPTTDFGLFVPRFAGKEKVIMENTNIENEEIQIDINNELLDKYENNGFVWDNREEYYEKYLNNLCNSLRKWEEKGYADEICFLLAKAEARYINIDKVLENVSSLEPYLVKKAIQKEAGVIKFNELDKKDYVIIDTETTGFGKDDEVIEIGITDREGNEILNKLVKPFKEPSKEASNVNGIFMKDLEDKENIGSIANEIREAIGDKSVVIFNKAFDTRMIIQTLEIHKEELSNQNVINELKEIFESRTYCIMHSYTELKKGFRSTGLANALKENGIEINQTHRAVGDCKDTAKLINLCIDEVKKKKVYCEERNKSR